MKGQDFEMQISIPFTDKDVRDCMPHLKSVGSVLALEEIEELLRSYLRESGCEIMWQLLHDAGWNIGGKQFKEVGGW